MDFLNSQVEPDGELLPLDTTAASPPSWHRTWFITLALAIFRRAKETVLSGRDASSAQSPNGHAQANADDDEDSSSEGPSSGAATPVTDGAGLKSRPTATVKAGGRRRKAPAPIRRRQQDKKDGSS